LAAALMVGLVGSTASAATITQNTNLGTVYNTTGVEEETLGNEMGGMTVVATIIRQNGTTFQLNGVWTDGIFGAGGVINWETDLLNDFELTVWGDTYTDGIWNLDFNYISQSYRLGSLLFNGVPGNTVFDTGFGGGVGTAGSSLGRDFAGFSGWGGNVTATYSNAVSLNGAAPVGDLYTSFLLTFGNGTYGQGLSETGFLGNPYSLTLDTDNARGLSPAAVPEPGSMLLLGTGLAGLASRLRRKKAA
jgi:PEP-CTERM motif